jgi:hypothetical protein
MNSFQLSEIKNLNGKKFKFHQIIKQIEDKNVIKFDGNKNLIKVLRSVSKSVITPINKSKRSDPNFPKRPNEFGNYVEKAFRDKMQENGYDCTKPRSLEGKSKETGYPDCLLLFEDKAYYLEIKTCESNSLKSTLRSFFYSPSNTSKIDRDATHLLIGFETVKNKLQLTGEVFITDLYNKTVILKLEYNSNNNELYKPEELI